MADMLEWIMQRGHFYLCMNRGLSLLIHHEPLSQITGSRPLAGIVI